MSAHLDPEAEKCLFLWNKTKNDKRALKVRVYAEWHRRGAQSMSETVRLLLDEALTRSAQQRPTTPMDAPSPTPASSRLPQ